MELKKELLEFLEANNNFGLIEGLVEGIVDTYISAYKQDDKPLNEKKKSPQSSVEWLIQQLRNGKEFNDNLIKQAKEIEQEQKIKFAKMHVKTALKAVENEMILHASSVKHWYLPQNIK